MCELTGRTGHPAPESQASQCRREEIHRSLALRIQKTQAAPTPEGISDRSRKIDMASAHSQKPSLWRAGRGVGWIALEMSGWDRKLAPPGGKQLGWALLIPFSVQVHALLVWGLIRMPT